MYKNLWDLKISSKWEVITINPYVKEKSQISFLILHFKAIEKEYQTKLKVNRKKEIMKIRTKTDKIQHRKTMEKINEAITKLTDL
jgi:hypothetical protein